MVPRIPTLLTMMSLLALGGTLTSIPYTDPLDWSDWVKYRSQVVHPVAMIKAEDIAKAKGNIARYEWAAKYTASLAADADAAVLQMTPAFLDMMVEVTTAGSTTPCPACRDQGLRWLPNNDWKWNVNNPNQLRCPHCNTVYPNDKYPETIKIRSKWDPRQEITFVDVPPFSCFGYVNSRSNPSGVIRGSKLNYVFGRLNPLSLAYALQGDIRYAETIKRILLKLAEVTPTYLVRVGYTYNEYADCDPHVAAKNILRLPVDELVAPPNVPDRKLWTGYWSASRYASAGMDGGYVIAMAMAYDLTCNAKYPDGRPLYTEEERLKIERDAILEAAYMGACDTLINNKSVGNRAGVAIAGLVLGHPGMVRFGIDGFVKTVESWFLPDGGTSESAGYAIMTMNGIYQFTYAFRDYTEPADYVPPAGAERLEHFNLARNTNYGTCWQGLIWILQGNYLYPPLADARFNGGLTNAFVEHVAFLYPTAENIALLHDKAGRVPQGNFHQAIFYRDPDAVGGKFKQEDVVFPYLSQGFFRQGVLGRDATAILNASDWGIHHHEDSLNLYLWKDGHELLVDLGYLWDHPDKAQTVRTVAHNLVVIDNKPQVRKERAGSFHYYAATPGVKAMCASSKAYGQNTYRRQLVQIDHGEAGMYWLDMFTAQGGERRDYLFHGPNCDVEYFGLEFTETEAVRKASGERPWHAVWTYPKDNYKFAVHVPGHAAEEVNLTMDWGQRSSENRDRGTVLPYIRLGRSGSQLDNFVAVYSGYPSGCEIVKNVTTREVTGAVVATVETVAGTDIVVLGADLARHGVTDSGVHTNAALTVVKNVGGEKSSAFMLGGTVLDAPDIHIAMGQACFEGGIVDVFEKGQNAWFELKGLNLPSSGDVQGQALIVKDEHQFERAYPIRKWETIGNTVRAYTKWEGVGFIARPAKTWRLPSVMTVAK